MNMNKMFSFLAMALCAIVLMAGCGSAPLSGKPGSSGKTLELMVVATNTVYNGVAHHALDTLFKTPQDGLNQPEPRFDVVQIAPSSFEDNTMFQAHRNILKLEVDPMGVNKIYLEKDKWSTPQVVIRVTATDARALDSMLLSHGERLLKEFYAQEYRRMEKVFAKTPDVKIMETIKQKYGFSLVVPDEYTMATMKENNEFTWILKRTKDMDLNVYLYSQPYKDEKYREESTILDNLDTMMRRFVPGPSEGSYPGVERRDFFYTRDVTIGDIKAVETRGLWRTYNDFMSGPFVCYTLLSPDGKSVITLMGSVYFPSYRYININKRDLLMQVDGICRSIKF